MVLDRVQSTKFACELEPIDRLLRIRLRGLPQGHEAIRLRIGERSQQDPVDDAEDGRRGAHAKGERQDGDE
jgi:hypothetical protein